MPPRNASRRQHILDTAADLIVRQGYDKTTLGEIAQEAGLGRGLVYLLFKNKDEIFEALIRRELRLYGQAWIEHLEADAECGTIGSIYRAVLHAVSSRPLMATLMRRERRVWGAYLRKPGNALAALNASALSADYFSALQAAGAVRADVDPQVTAHVLDLFAYGLMTVSEFRPAETLPPFDAVMSTLADLLDRALTPPNGGDRAAGRAVIVRIADQARAFFETTEDVTP